ncbi:hypothetical protein PV327_002221 [Microctonus hyperodae]|uniref:Anti-proliferative protein domain-containing protein n=1 Tax=Microctonus hyperodae TaxID=165561 RepID=A0AA39FFA0_MICHY|nr:hypothetical protein PV327_002221 [Microctonus hyperodae]
MHKEISVAVQFLVKLIGRNKKFSPDQLDCLTRCLTKLLTERFENHWFPDKPFKGQGYRCIRVNGRSKPDETLESAANEVGIKYEDLSLPIELTIWVDPDEVCYRFGEHVGSCCTLASFEKKRPYIIYEETTLVNKETKDISKLSKVQTDIAPTAGEQKLKQPSSSNQNHQRMNNTGGLSNRNRRYMNITNAGTHFVTLPPRYNCMYPSLAFPARPRIQRQPNIMNMSPHFRIFPPSSPSLSHKSISMNLRYPAYHGTLQRINNWNSSAPLKV